MITIGGRHTDLAAIVDDLSGRRVNYDERQAPPHVTDGWHQDRCAVELGHESPGEPEPDGLVHHADLLVNGYEFTDPKVLRAAFRSPHGLVGRDMLLEGRFLFIRFLLGVRITEVTDEHRDGPNGPERVIGWSYQTLEGHLEEGRLDYQIVKDLTTGRVQFRIEAYSRQGSIPNPLFRLGFAVFGRGMQVRFYRRALDRMRTRLPDPPAPPEPDENGLVHVPTGTPSGRFEALTVRILHPGR